MAALIAKLLKKQRIRIRYNAEYLDPELNTNTLIMVFTKIADADRAIIDERVITNPNLILSAKRVCKEVFNKTDLADDEDGLVKDIRTLIEKQILEIKGLKARYEGRQYPGKSLLDKGLEYFEQFHNGLDNATFFTKIKELEDDLAEWEDDVTYVKSFFSTNQKELFDKALTALINYEENKAYLVGEEVVGVMNKLHSIVQDPMPYKKIKDISELIHAMEQKIVKVLSNKKANAHEKLKVDYDYLSLQAKQYGVSNETKQRVDQYYSDLNESLNLFKDIYKVDATISQSTSYKENMEKSIQREIKEWQRKKEDEQRERPDVIVIEPIVPIIQKETVKVSNLVQVTTLSTEEDVDQYINTLSNKLKQIIRSNKQIEFIE